VAGDAAQVLFATGLLGASVLAAGVLPLATAYSVTESLGFEKGVSLSFREAPVFIGLFTALLAIGAVVAMVPGLPLFAVLIAVQILNGALLPVLLVFILLLAADTQLMREMRNNRLHNLLGWATVVLVTCAVLVLFGSHLL
jgi:Mn2+/Fe2+ NRAMP family transporter